jgi:hypothetical protein
MVPAARFPRGRRRARRRASPTCRAGELKRMGLETTLRSGRLRWPCHYPPRLRGWHWPEQADAGPIVAFARLAAARFLRLLETPSAVEPRVLELTQSDKGRYFVLGPQAQPPTGAVAVASTASTASIYTTAPGSPIRSAVVRTRNGNCWIRIRPGLRWMRQRLRTKARVAAPIQGGRGENRDRPAFDREKMKGPGPYRGRPCRFLT